MIINEKINSDGYIWNDGGRIDDVAKISETAYPTKIDSCKTKLISSEIGGGNGKEYCDVLWAVDNKGNEIAAYSYTNAVVLEYAAYLMTASGSSEENLTIDELADLWYCTMLTLPSNCTYSILRENMEMMAAIKGYSDEKRSNISSSFETIGFELQSQHLSTSFDLTVVDTDGIVCTDYTIEISGMKNTLWWSTEYAETITVDDENVKHIELPKGNYQLTITSKEKDFSASRKISVTHSKNKNNSLVIVAEGTKTISQNEYIANQLIGEWSHDANKTYAETGIIVQNLFGSSIKYGSTMIFGTDGSFSYGIAAGIGGEGTFAVVDNKTVSYCITTYEEECAENGILTIDDSGEQIYLIMNYGDAKVYWSKKTGENGKEDTSFSTEETCSPNENNHSITITDDSSAEDLRKAIIGEWYDPNFAVNNYTFFENGSCKMMYSDAEPGTFEITADKTLKINMPWTTKNFKWDSNCLYSFVGWYFTSDGDLIIEGNVLKRQ